MNAAKANDTIDPARRLQRARYRAAKASATRRFHALDDKVYREDILLRAWQEVQANAGAAGADRQTLEQIEHSGVEGFLAELATELREGRYRPQAVRRVRRPKADGGERPLGIPAVRDRVVQAAAKVVPESILEADFRDSSYGFRPKRDAHQAGERIRQGVNRGANWVVDADIAAFFDRIDHAVLRQAITAPRHRLPEPVQPILTELNRLLRGWGTYFRVGNSARQFQQVDQYVDERLRLFLSKKAGRTRRDWKRHTGTYLQALGVSRLSGTVAWYQAAPTAVR